MKGKWMRKGLLHLILITFLFTGLSPTPLYAAEALKEGAVALSRAESSSKPFAQSILGISPPLVQSTEGEKGLLDTLTGLFKSDSKKKQRTISRKQHPSCQPKSSCREKGGSSQEGARADGEADEERQVL
jgi:hypothetical protein